MKPDPIVARSNLISAALRSYAVRKEPLPVQVKASLELDRAVMAFGRAQKETQHEG